MVWTLLPAWLIQDASELRDGDLASAKFLNMVLSLAGFELTRSRAIGGSAKVYWVVDTRHEYYLVEGFLPIWDSLLRRVNAVQTTLNDWLGSGRRTLLYSFAQSWNLYVFRKTFTDDVYEDPPEEPSEPSIPSYAVAVSAVVLLSLVYHYLTGNVDRGGSKAYSRSSLDFRDIYVAIVLFLGAYVWIKFREVAQQKGVYSRKLPDKQGGIKVVYEANTCVRSATADFSSATTGFSSATAISRRRCPDTAVSKVFGSSSNSKNPGFKILSGQVRFAFNSSSCKPSTKEFQALRWRWRSRACRNIITQASWLRHLMEGNSRKAQRWIHLRT